MYISKEWIVKDKTNVKEPLLKRLLALRGITTEEELHDFLNPLEITITHPNAFCDMSNAADRIMTAIENKEKILVYGDFDADGVTSTSLLLRTLKELGADVDYYIPDRENDGHGLNTKALVKIMTTKKPKLFITCDCGISNIEEVKLNEPINILDLIVKLNFTTSKGEAKRLIQGGGVKFEGEKISDFQTIIEKEGILQAGKRKYAKLTFW